MRVAVVGAGIVGVTSAYELAADGHEVTVFERRGSVAAEDSFANAGVAAPDCMAPWAASSLPARVLRHLLNPHPAVRMNPRLGPGTLRWMWRWWRSRGLAVVRTNGERIQRLAGYSRDRLHSLRHKLQLDYERSEGYLVLLRSKAELSNLQPGLAMLTGMGVRFDLLDVAQCFRLEPGLNADTPLHGGISLPQVEVGNCRQFALLLRNEAQQLGVDFRFHTTVLCIQPGRRPSVAHLHEPHDESTLLAPGAEAPRSGAGLARPRPLEPAAESFDAVLVCAAMGAPALLAPHGLRLPLAPVYGYSVTAPMRHHEAHPDSGPRSALMDERYRVAISRLGSRIRVSGSAELGGQPRAINQAALATLYKVMNDWFPGAARMSQTQRWKGARPMLPDGPPVLGASGIDGIWVNLGHGDNGWALACGSARVIADAIGNRRPGIDVEGLSVDRLRNGWS